MALPVNCTARPPLDAASSISSITLNAPLVLVECEDAQIGFAITTIHVLGLAAALVIGYVVFVAFRVRRQNRADRASGATGREE